MFAATMILPMLALPFLLCLLQYAESDKVIRVIPKNHEHMRVIRDLESTDKFDFWTHVSHVGKPVDIMIPEKDFNTVSRQMSDKGIPFTVNIPDVHKLVEQFESRRVKRAASFSHTDYNRLSEINDKLKSLESKYGNAQVLTIGRRRTYQGRYLRAIKVKGAYKPNKPVFYWQCGIHAREWISPATCMYAIDQMVTKYGKDSGITSMLDKMDFVILPVVNPDGYEYTWTKGNRLWRKNRNPNNADYGTDLNRNWDYMWGGAGTSGDGQNSVYRGPHPFSEAETKNIRDYLQSVSNLKGFIDMHAYSQMWFTPWGYTSSVLPKHYDEQKQAAKAAVYGIRRAGYNTRYTYGSSAKILYPAAGGCEDWVYGKLRVMYSFSVELRDTGSYGFLLPEDQIIPTGHETLEGVKALVRHMKV